MRHARNVRGHSSTERLERRMMMAAGDLDPSFSGDGKAVVDVPVSSIEEANAVAVLADGKILVAGTAGGDFLLARLTASGALDTTFGVGGPDGNGVTTTDFGHDRDAAHALLVLPGGKILLAGTRGRPSTEGNFNNDDFALARYNANGTLDTTFGVGGPDGDGKVTTDFTFTTDDGIIFDSSDAAHAMALSPGGKILLGGYAQPGPNPGGALARYNPDGSPDGAFGDGGELLVSVPDVINALGVLADGRFYAAGSIRQGSAAFDFGLARLRADGSPDSTFGGGDGLVVTELFPGDGVAAGANALAVLGDGKVLVAGDAGRPDDGGVVLGTTQFGVLRYTSGGTLDPAFGPGGADGDGAVTTTFAPDQDSSAQALVLLPGGKFVVAGSAGGDVALARYNANGGPDATFGGDGRVTTDFAGGVDVANALAVQPDGKLVAAGRTRVGTTANVALSRYRADPDIDDQTGEAIRTNVGTGKTGAVTPATDVDLYRVYLNAGQRVTFDVDRTTGSTLDSRLRLFNSGGSQIATNDNANAPGESAATPKESYLAYTAPSTGVYYVGVSGAANNAYSAVAGTGDKPASTGGYTLVVGGAGDGDDQIGEARPAADGVFANPSISPGSDVDMYLFAARAGQRIGFDVDRRSGSTLDSHLRLFNASGTQLASNDNANAPGETAAGPRESYLEFTFSTAGTYFVAVSGAPNRTYNAVKGAGDVSGSGGGYFLRLVERTPASVYVQAANERQDAKAPREEEGESEEDDLG